MQIKLIATEVFEKNWKALHSDVRFIVNEGGSRSSKTYSLCQCVILYCLQNPNTLVSIVRKTGPSLTASVLRDLFQVMREMGIYDPKAHQVKNQIYIFPNGSAIDFFSADDEQKLRGRKRTICWVNESNEISYEEFQQLALRTTKKLILDYNPSSPDFWGYELPNDKTIRIHSTYLDNPFLTKEIIEQIESYRESDPDYYTIFALGKRCFSSENVFKEWKQCERPSHLVDYIYGIDFGFRHATALVKIWYSRTSREIWVEEVIYETELTSTDILQKMESQGVDRHVPIVAEVARPEILEDLRRRGYTVYLADKNVQDGLLTMKSFKIQISPEAKNIQKENFNYRYKSVNGKPSEEPVKLFDDAIDAVRYGVMYIKKYCLQEPGISQGQVLRFNF